MKQLIKKVFNIITIVISFFVKRSDKIVICGGWFGQRFADNSKAMYLYLYHNKHKLGLKRVVYVTRNKLIYNDLCSNGYDTLLLGTRASFFTHIRARYHIIDQCPRDISHIWSCSAIRINLWHAFPFKKIGYLITKQDMFLEDVINSKQVILGSWEDFYNLALSEKHKELQQFAMGLPDEKMIIGAYPRICYMMGYIEKYYLNSEAEKIARIQFIKEKKRKIIAYFPTFRDNIKQNTVCQKLPNNLITFLEEFDIYLLTKMHFASYMEFTENSNRIINLPPESDIYNFLNEADILITDYSSVYFDYILFNRPIVFYCFDLEFYESQDRGLLFSYDSFTSGDKAFNLSELILSLKQVLADEDRYKEKYKKTYQYVMDTVYQSPNANENAMNELWHKIERCTKNNNGV